MSERTSIKFICAALDEKENEIVLRGVIDPASLVNLQIADYQREILPQSKINALMTAIRKGGVPDIQLGCRGGNYIPRENAYYIQDPVYIIDGLQRCTAAIKLMEKGLVPHLGATLTFNTTEEMERERFRVLNVTRVKLSPNVLLRNERHSSEAVAAIFQLCMSSQFALYKRVCWSQRMKREELISAMTLMKVAGEIHRRFGTSLGQRRQDILVPALDRLVQKFGRATLMNNLREYWEVLAEAFRINEVVYTEIAPALRHGFLMSFAKVIWTHQDFWEDANLIVPKELRRKLASFPLRDPNIAALCGSSSSSVGILASMIANHLNSGKKSKRLRPFAPKERDEIIVGEEEEQPEQVEVMA